MATLPIEWPRKDVEAFCARHHIRKLSLFGSVLTPRFQPSSDIDVLVESDEGNVPGLFRLADIELELSDPLGRKVDLRMPEEIGRHFRDRVLASAVVQYER